MANRMFHQSQSTLEPGVVRLFAEVAIGSSGAATLTRGRGISSVAKSTTGVYLVTLADKYTRVLAVQASAKNASTFPNAPFVFQSAADTVSTNKTLTLTTCAASGTSGALVATEPASGNVYYLEITLLNSGA